MAMTHIMVDLETWGLRPGCAIRSIGAVVFDPYSDIIGGRFYRNVDLESCIDLGLCQESVTVEWWNKPEMAEARKAFEEQPVFTIRQAAMDFKKWFHRQLGKQFWSQGANFDEPILTHIFDHLEIQVPWKFFNARDTRTCYEMAKFNTKTITRVGNHHNALDDAEHQVLCVQAAYAKRKNK